tara:strand:- start:106 stop:321 length:216 start_codon:yes stop_codon:yes gene_type:complete
MNPRKYLLLLLLVASTITAFSQTNPIGVRYDSTTLVRKGTLVTTGVRLGPLMTMFIPFWTMEMDGGVVLRD